MTSPTGTRGTGVAGPAALDAYMNGFAAAFPGHRFRTEGVHDHHDHSLARWAQVGPDGQAFMTGINSAVHRGNPRTDVTGFFLPA